ncbi:auxilin-like protein 1 [Artemisia annua]|uniref:Auxilin-like protein 1 n=1 Tax=Artemisia annua TaxID=35608 RepID=A0A2U1MB48_ARTAN|nr:auxilin-like protein 1 [Artemisia annua]
MNKTLFHPHRYLLEMFYNVCKAETNENAQTCDDIIEKSKASVETFDNISEEHDGHELEQNENHIAEKTDEYLDYISYEEFKDKSSCDDNVVEEIDSINGIHEAHEHAFSEACERAKNERVAVEKATEENRPQKLLLGLYHHLSEVLHGRSVEQKRRAECAAVERATLEAQQRALEKEVSQKTDVLKRLQKKRSEIYLQRRNKLRET